MKTQLPHVSSEGGPLLIGDSDDLCDWNGSELALFNQACASQPFAVTPIEFGGKSVLSWDFGGAGTAFLVKSDNTEAAFVRFWSDSEVSDSVIADLLEIGNDSIASASLTVRSGSVLVLWAAEDARNIVAPTTGFGRPRGLAVGDAGYFISLDAGRYEVKSSHYFKNQIEVAVLRLLRLTD